jgi:hypothetical protein
MIGWNRIESEACIGGKRKPKKVKVLLCNGPCLELSWFVSFLGKKIVYSGLERRV